MWRQPPPSLPNQASLGSSASGRVPHFWPVLPEVGVLTLLRNSLRKINVGTAALGCPPGKARQFAEQRPFRACGSEVEKAA